MVSKYRLDRLLGAGGMGSVYLAHDQDLDRDVAIKFISPERAADPNARRRLIREARAAASLDHPNICAVHDVIVEPDGHAFIVMQYVEGETLSARLQRGPLEPRQALLIAADVAAALAAAHRRGIIHRDVKPQNVIITPSGKAKLLDFGIARLDDPVASPGDSTATNLTGPGRAAGTPIYMSPEQVQQRPLDGRSDLFSLGAVVYECFTGRKPFDGGSDAEIYIKILQEHPPAVSATRPELTEQEDELCRRLLAKHPDDRFSSADELLGALRVLAPDTAHSSSGSHPVRVDRAGPLRAVVIALRSRKLQMALLVLGVIAAAGVWGWRSSRALPAPPADAERWYVKGTQLIRDGAYQSGRLALEEAVKIFPEYALAYARLAEAYSDLDDLGAAQRSLLTVDRLVPNRSRLPIEDRLRLDAVRALVLQDASGAVKAYTALADLRPGDAGVWLDLGRAQESAAGPINASKSYELAIAADSQYAAAHLRRAAVLTHLGKREEALEEFDEAERLYRAAAAVEGQSETLLRRGTFLASLGRLTEARPALERARMLAASVQSRSQEITVRLRLSSLSAREGRFSEAEKLAAEAVDAALANGLESVAADGLIELGARLMRDRPDDANARLERAIELAEKRGAQRLAARARLQRAALLLTRNRVDEALPLADAVVTFTSSHGYTQLELNGLTILARGYEMKKEYDRARQLAERVLKVAEGRGDDTQIAEALENLAGQATALGDLPRALAFRERRERLNRAHGIASGLAYDLPSRAELLLRLGRFDEADALLNELAGGIAKGVEAYKPRAARAQMLRALHAALAERFDLAAAAAAAVPSVEPPTGTNHYAAALLAYAEAKRGRRRAAPTVTPAGAPDEVTYWRIMAAFAAREDAAVLGSVTATLNAGVVSSELEWRLAALGAAAATRVESADRTLALRARAQQALDRVRDQWKEHARAYENRPDLVELRRAAGLSSRP